jgi:hypothetical protein
MEPAAGIHLLVFANFVLVSPASDGPFTPASSSNLPTAAFAIGDPPPRNFHTLPIPLVGFGWQESLFKAVDPIHNHSPVSSTAVGDGAMMHMPQSQEMPNLDTFSYNDLKLLD